MSSTQCQQALDFIARVDAREYESTADLLSEGFTHRVLPASLNGLGMPVRNKQQFLDNMKRLEAVVQRFNFQPPKEIIQGQDVVVLHLVNEGKTTNGTPFNGEFIFIFRFEGEKIASIKEFMDSRHVTDILESMKAQ